MTLLNECKVHPGLECDNTSFEHCGTCDAPQCCKCSRRRIYHKLDWAMTDDNKFEILDDGKRIAIVDAGENSGWWAMTIVHAVNKATEDHIEYINKSLHSCELNRLADGTCSVCGAKY